MVSFIKKMCNFGVSSEHSKLRIDHLSSKCCTTTFYEQIKTISTLKAVNAPLGFIVPHKDLKRPKL